MAWAARQIGRSPSPARTGHRTSHDGDVALNAEAAENVKACLAQQGLDVWLDSRLASALNLIHLSYKRLQLAGVI